MAFTSLGEERGYIMIPHPDSPILGALSNYKQKKYQDEAAIARILRKALGPSLAERILWQAALNSIAVAAGLLAHWYEEIKYKLTN